MEVGTAIAEAGTVVSAIQSDPTLALRMHAHRLTIQSLVRQMEEANATILRERTEHEYWIARLTSVAHEVADEQEWCDIADNGLADLGLPARIKEEDVSVEVRVFAQFTLNDEDVDVESDVARHFGVDTDDVSDLEMTVSGTVQTTIQITRTVNEGDCACSLIDRDVVYAETPGWIDELGWDWEVNNCGNCS